MRDGPTQTLHAFDHCPARLALRELARLLSGRWLSRRWKSCSKLFSLDLQQMPNVASEGRRSAQHGGVPSTGWLGDEANLLSKPTGLHDADHPQDKWPSASRGFRRSDVRGAQQKTVQALNHSPPRQAPRELARTADWIYRAAGAQITRAHRRSSMRDGSTLTLQAFDHRPTRLALKELARLLFDRRLSPRRKS